MEKPDEGYQLLEDLDAILDQLKSGHPEKPPVIEEEYLQGLKKKMEILFNVNKIYRLPDLGSAMLAERLGTNTYYLSILVNRHLNTSLRDYINTFRVKEAQVLILDRSSDHLTLEAIGDKVGFQSRSSFYRVFKRITGISPNLYKQNQAR